MSSSNQVQNFGPIPYMPRRQIALGLGRLSIKELEDLFVLWILDKYKQTETSDIRYRILRLKEDLKNLTKKEFIIKWMEEFMQNSITPYQEAQLETAYFIKHQSRIKWNVYHMKRSQLADPIEEIAPKIAHKISKCLQVYFSKLVYAAKDEHIMWLRIAIYQGQATSVVYPKIYIVYVPGTNFFLASNIRNDIKPFLFQALSEAFNLNAIDTLPLFGNDPKSLLDLVLNQYSQGAISSYRLNQVENEPLAIKKYEFKIPENYQPRWNLPKQIVDENKLLKGQQRFYTKNTFGENELPIINSLFLKVELPFRQQPSQQDSLALSQEELPFKMSIKLEGKHILEGLRELSFISPLAPYLEDVASKRTNHIVVTRQDEFRF